MDKYLHYVSGFFVTREAADSAFARLVEQRLPRERLQIFEPSSVPPPPGSNSDSNEVLKEVLIDGAIGTAVGTGVGALGELALVAANVSMFVASPLIAPLVMMGWGASVGGFIGAAAGAADIHKKGPFSMLVLDAISSGQFVLVAATHTEQETAIAREIIQAAVGAYNDSDTA